MTRVYDRKTKLISELPQYGENKLRFLYGNPIGRIFLGIASSRWYSSYNAWKKSRPKSKADIAPFVEKYHIQIDDIDQYNSFAAFIARQENRTVVKDKNALIAPADSKLMYYAIDNRELVKIKNTVYSIEDLVGEDISGYAGGICLVFRLAIDDYHRYCFVDSGKLISSKHIRGRLHTVSSISEKYRVFVQNDRVISKLETENFGEIYQIEVGAILVGRIKNNNQKTFTKGEEKGHFEMGGSTIVLLLKKGITIDKDIIGQSKINVETIVKYGEKIGGKNV